MNLTTVLTSVIVLVLLALPFVAARLPRSRSHLSHRYSLREANRSGPGPGFTYALVPPGGHPEIGDDNEQGSWQWCLAFIPEETSNGGSEMPPWWAPAPPWDATGDSSQNFTRDADALQAIIEETSVHTLGGSNGH